MPVRRLVVVIAISTPPYPSACTWPESPRPTVPFRCCKHSIAAVSGEVEAAHYALVYTLSQDKSGIDVSNDSLLRLAYNHYRTLPTDSLYSRCMYYMGKYYLLTDSAHAAAHCLHEAERAAAASCDTAVQCMAIENYQPSRIGMPPINPCNILTKPCRCSSLFASHLYQSHSPAACQRRKSGLQRTLQGSTPFGQALAAQRVATRRFSLSVECLPRFECIFTGRQQ